MAPTVSYICHRQSCSRQRKSDERLAEMNETYPESSIDTTLLELNNTAGPRKVVQTHLSSDSMTSSGEQLGDANCLKPTSAKPKAARTRNPAPLKVIVL